MKKIIFLLLIIVSFFIPSCFNPENGVIIASDEMSIDSTQGSCPFLTTDQNGNIVISWIKMIDTATSVFSYSVSKNGGKTFGKTIEIPGSEKVHPHGENMPKIIFKPSGEIIAVWPVANPNPKNDYSDLVYFSQSFDDGNTWSKVKPLVTDTAGYDQRYFDLAILPNGEAAIIWLDNRKTTNHTGSALYYATTNGASGFINERRIGEPCCECCRTDLFIDSKQNIHVLYRAIINDSIRDMVHSISKDNGKTFSAPKRISEDNWVINGCPHTGPAITENSKGLQLTWFTAGGKAGIYYCYSNDDGETFSKREMVSGSSAKHCQLASVNNKIAIAWNENFVLQNDNFSRIGVEIRNENGEKPNKQFITLEKGSATFPVIKSIDKNSVLIGYTITLNGKDYIKYKVVKI